MAYTIAIPSHRVRRGRVTRFFSWFFIEVACLRKEVRLIRRYLTIIERGIPRDDKYTAIFDAGASRLDRALLRKGRISTSFTFTHGNVCQVVNNAFRKFPRDPETRHAAIVTGTRRQLMHTLRCYAFHRHFRTVYDE